MPSLLLSFIRFCDSSGALALFGYLFFKIYIQRLTPAPRFLRRGFGFVFLSSLAWMIISCLDMSDGLDLQMIWYAISKTTFAHWWCLRLVLLFCGWLFISYFKALAKRSLLLLILSGSALFISSLTSHAAVSETYPFLRIGLDFAHSISASIWAGGLLGVFLFLHHYLRDAASSASAVHSTVKRFSHFAMVSTGVLTTCGVFQVYLIEPSLKVLWASQYGKLIFLKLILFSIALLAAAINQFKHLNRWQPGADASFARAVRREVGIEMFIITIVLAVTSVLTRANLPGLQ